MAGDEGRRGPEAATVARVVHRALAAKLINHATGSLNHGNLRQLGEPKRKLSPANCLLRPTDASVDWFHSMRPYDDAACPPRASPATTCPAAAAAGRSRWRRRGCVRA